MADIWDLVSVMRGEEGDGVSERVDVLAYIPSLPCEERESGGRLCFYGRVKS